MAENLLIPEALKRQALLGTLGDPTLAPDVMGGGLPPIAPAAPVQAVLNPRISSITSDPLSTRKSQVEADLYNRENPIAPTTALGKIGHTAANIGNVLGNIFAPGVMALSKGTQLNNQVKIADDKDDLNQISALETEADKRKQTEALTDYTQQRPEIESAKLDQKRRAAQNTLAEKLRATGHVPHFDENGELIDAPDDPDSQAFKDRVGLTDYRNTLTDFKKLQTENLDGKYKPGTPQYEEWHAKLQQAQQRLAQGAASLGIQGQRLGFEEDKQYNPEPTATERKTGDLAQSAVNQVRTLRQIVNSNPSIFGPGAGRSNRIQQWLGSQSPDAAAYNAAQTYLAEHSAGVFGGRGAYIIKGLHSLTDEHNNPDALNAVFNEAEKTAQHFVNAGAVHAKGQQGFAAKGDTPNAPPRPANVPEGYHYDEHGPKGKGWYR